jgi:hypothetical protein
MNWGGGATPLQFYFFQSHLSMERINNTLHLRKFDTLYQTLVISLVELAKYIKPQFSGHGKITDNEEIWIVKADTNLQLR